MSGTFTISDQRSYVKIKTLCSRNPTEIHSTLSEVHGEITVDHSMVSRWDNRCRDGYVSIENDPRPGRPRISTDEGSVKLGTDALKRRSSCSK